MEKRRLLCTIHFVTEAPSANEGPLSGLVSSPLLSRSQQLSTLLALEKCLAMRGFVHKLVGLLSHGVHAPPWCHGGGGPGGLSDCMGVGMGVASGDVSGVGETTTGDRGLAHGARATTP